MNWIKYLNPFRSLFGRIFLWFWLATIVLIVSMATVNNQLNDDFELEPANEKQQMALARIGERLAKAGTSPFLTRKRLQKLIRNPRVVRDLLVVLYQPERKTLIANHRLPPRVRSSDMLPLALADELSQMSTPTHTIFGPVALNLAGQKFVLLVGKHKPSQTPLERFQSQDPSIRIAMAILVSGFFCFFLAWSLIKPIRRLQKASKELASGYTKAQVNGVVKRSDELGQLSRDFNAMAQRIDSLLGAQKRLLGDISHELRTPLTRLQLAVGLAHECDSDALEKHLLRVESEAEKIESMIAQVLQLSRLETQPELIQPQKLELNSLIQELVDAAALEANSQDKSVEFFAEGQVHLLLDNQLVSSAIENLIRNGIKYTAEKTAVDIYLKITTEHVEILVCDNGPGVPEEELGKLFTPFYRVSESRQRQSGGTGLGLAIAERAVIAHGGSIRAENRSEGGLTVTIMLPIAQNLPDS